VIITYFFGKKIKTDELICYTIPEKHSGEEIK